MKEHSDTTFNALVEAMHRNEAGTFIELVNNCDDLFGHDADGHSLMWHARQSQNPIFAETLDLLAAGKPFTEEASSATDASDNKETTLDNQADEEKSILPDNNKLDEKPESAASAESPTATSDSTAGDIKAIPVEKLGWAAVIVLLTIAVIGYFWHLYYSVESQSYLTIHTGPIWLSGIGFSIAAITEACVALWVLLKADNKRNYVVSGFLPILVVSFAAAAGAFYSDDCNKTEIAIIFGGLVALACVHLIYNSFRKPCLFGAVQRVGELALLLFGTLMMFGLSYVMLDWRELGLWLMPFAAICLCMAYPILSYMVMDADFSEADYGLWVMSSKLCSAVLFVSFIIFDLWYATVYSAAEFATYHDMPAVVETILPNIYIDSRVQRRHIYSDRVLKGWCKAAMQYAATHGDVRSAKAYMKLVVWEWDDALKLDDAALSQQMKYDDPEMLELFIDKNADGCLNAMMKENAQKNAVHLIHKNGSNATYGERTLLQAAVENNSVEMIELLLKHGADPDFAKSGKTPRQMAEEKKWGYALKLFKENGVKASASGASTEPDYGKLLLGE